MSRFFSDRFSALKPYTPGEQPQNRKYVKLNTNESPFPPSRLAREMASKEAERLMLYSDPECRELCRVFSEEYGVAPDEVIFGNGSDELLNFAFMAFCSDAVPAVYADITYGFYKVYAALNRIPSRVIPLEDDFTIDIDKYISTRGTVFIANPNAPTGIALPLFEIERLVASDRNIVVIIDEAYVDFGAESAVSLTRKYDNLMVIGTFSKSRSMAGARLGYAIASPELIADINRLKYSTNPYNINRMTMAAGVGAISDRDYFKDNCQRIIECREWTVAELTALGFSILPSSANFIFAKSSRIDGERLYRELKERGVLVRHFSDERIKEYNRITIGNSEQMQILVDKIKEILEETK